MKRNISVAVVPFCLLGFAVFGHAADCRQGWRDRRKTEEAEVLRGYILPKASELPDYAQIREIFEKAIAKDPSAAAQLAVLTGHSNDQVAAAAAAVLGHYPTVEWATRLKQVFQQDGRSIVRGGALAGLVRMNDPEAGALAARALTESDLRVQLGGAFALRRLRDNRYGSALLAFTKSDSKNG